MLIGDGEWHGSRRVSEAIHVSCHPTRTVLLSGGLSLDGAQLFALDCIVFLEIFLAVCGVRELCMRHQVVLIDFFLFICHQAFNLDWSLGRLRTIIMVRISIA